MLLLSLIGLSIGLLKANINFALDYASFYAPGEKPYIEFYLSINGNTLNYAETSPDKFQAQLEITYLIEQEGKVVSFEKFQLNSPEYTLEASKLDLLDLKRIPIEEGDYSLSLIIKDLITGNQQESTLQLPAIHFPADLLSISQIQLANSFVKSSEESDFVKNGIDITPNVSHVYGKDKNELSFYAEIYNANKSLAQDEGYLLEYKIVEEESEKVAANLRGIKRMKANEITPIIQSLGLTELPTGNFTLIVNAINQKNEIIATSSSNFFRSNPKQFANSDVDLTNSFVDSITNKEELAEYINSLRPISSSDELQFAQNQIEFADLKFMQKYFFNFWKVRDELNPAEKWFSYKEKVELVNEEFGYGGVKGYQTERGRVYLQYGPPSSVQNVPYDNDTYPYSIWQYYKLQGLTDRKFIFYSPSMEMLGYEILHSNVRGEITNPGWEADLINKTNGGRRSTRENPQDRGVIINQNSRTLFDNPR